jgi:hypothetical protein
VAIPKGFRGLSLVENLSFASKYNDLQQHTSLRRHTGSPHQSADWFAMTSYFLCVATGQQHNKLKLERRGAGMNRISQIKESPNYGRIKNSLEFRAQRHGALIVWIFTAVMLLVASIAGVGNSARGVMSFILLILFMVTYSLYYVYRLAVLFWKIDHWVFSETLLDKPHQWRKGGAWFTVTLRDRSGREIVKDTSHIFGNVSDPVFEDCVNKRALVGYNSETDTVAVIQILP